jgi:hypothetical protein
VHEGALIEAMGRALPTHDPIMVDGTADILLPGLFTQ